MLRGYRGYYRRQDAAQRVPLKAQVEQRRAVGQRRRDGPLKVGSKNSPPEQLDLKRDARTLNALVETGSKKNTGEKTTAGGDR